MPKRKIPHNLNLHHQLFTEKGEREERLDERKSRPHSPPLLEAPFVKNLLFFYGCFLPVTIWKESLILPEFTRALSTTS